MSRREILRWGPERLRVGPWRGDSTVAYVTPVWESPPPSATLVRRAIALLEARGVTDVLTGALSAREQEGFLEAGFEVRDALHLLSHDLRDVPPRPGHVALRRARRRDRGRVLDIDAAAFDPFWRLDANGLEEALDATPATRFRVAHRQPTAGAPPRGERPLAGYAVAGRAGGRGYLQRLAVAPAAQRGGVGTALVVDALQWLRRRGAGVAAVNTQVTNEVALGLYLRLGFRLEPGGLAVLGRSLQPADPVESRR